MNINIDNTVIHNRLVLYHDTYTVPLYCLCVSQILKFPYHDR